MTTPTTATLQAKPVLVIWQVEDKRVEATPNGVALCDCERFNKNRAMWGDGYCSHTEAV